METEPRNKFKFENYLTIDDVMEAERKDWRTIEDRLEIYNALITARLEADKKYYGWK